MSYDNNNKGAIWGNDRKQNDNHPDFKGQATINGVEYWVSAWKRKPDASPSSPALSFSVQPKEQAFNDGKKKVQKAIDTGFCEDPDIPF